MEETRVRWRAHNWYRRFCVSYYYYNVCPEWWWTEQACVLRVLNGILARMMKETGGGHMYISYGHPTCLLK